MTLNRLIERSILFKNIMSPLNFEDGRPFDPYSVWIHATLFGFHDSYLKNPRGIHGYY